MLQRIFFICACAFAFAVQAQPVISIQDTTATRQVLIAINQALDQAVVDKKAAILEKGYAADFYFLHGSGQIDSKQSWMNYVLDTATHYGSRIHDSVQVELHKDVVVLAGTLTVKRAAQNKSTGYALRYIRVYAYRKKVWQLLSHRTIREWPLPDVRTP